MDNQEVKVVICDASKYGCNNADKYKTDYIHRSIVRAVALNVPIQFCGIEIGLTEYNHLTRLLSNDYNGRVSPKKREQRDRALSMLTRGKTHPFGSWGLIPDELYDTLSYQELLNIGSWQVKSGEYVNIIASCSSLAEIKDKYARKDNLSA